MTTKLRDYSALDRFNFERKPVGVKFLIERPEGVPRLGKELNFCEMLKEAQEDGAFYVGPDDWVCVGVEQMILGMKDPESILVGGILGGDEGLFKSASACRAMYQHLPRLPKDSVRYVAFAPLDELSFDPDVLIITADIGQAQAVLRAVNYSTGEPYTSVATPVVACGWIYVYPVVSGRINYFVTGLGLGMDAMNMFPPGLFLISIPFQLIPTALENLKEMSYDRNPTPGVGGKAHRKRVNQLLVELRERIGD